ncbi:MAG: hypothetical protein BWY93_00378 [Euryarchaeota archaeon ADurb.BinA087]|nr:MAG: hypothetical protein BWY93_00378 [Euryarchaeota archaeon ADurb.BinA087]HQA80084.1 hypothetical protein [Methanoregulaceae archaeon]
MTRNVLLFKKDATVTIARIMKYRYSYSLLKEKSDDLVHSRVFPGTSSMFKKQAHDILPG